MMAKSAKVLLAAPLAAMIGALLLAGAAPLPKGAAPPPKASAPPPKASPHASAEPAEAQLPPVDPQWHQNGWHAVVPHAYVVRGLAPARIRPEPGAPAAFWLKGGVRVPILEQRAEWWRVGWIHGQSGWLPAAVLQPHAAFVLLDVQTGRVRRRLAAKGEQGPIAAGGFLWSFSDTGITRTSSGEPPAFWSNPARPDPHGSLPEEGVWTPDRSAFFVGANPHETGALLKVSVRTGVVRRAGPPGSPLSLEGADAKGRLLLSGEAHVHLYDAGSGREIRRAPGEAQAVAKNGSVYASVKYASGRRELIRYDSDLNPAVRVKLAGDLSSARLSAHERILALIYKKDKSIELRRADDTFAMVTTLHPGRDDAAGYVNALAGGANGWWVIGPGEEDDSTSVTHYTRQGVRVRTWRSDSSSTIMSPDGRFIYMPRKSDLLVIDTSRGTTRRIPYSWRRPLRRQYLPAPSDPESPPHLFVSALTLTPDGRTLILTEWLNGDPET